MILVPLIPLTFGYWSVWPIWSAVWRAITWCQGAVVGQGIQRQDFQHILRNLFGRKHTWDEPYQSIYKKDQVDAVALFF